MTVLSAVSVPPPTVAVTVRSWYETTVVVATPLLAGVCEEVYTVMTLAGLVAATALSITARFLEAGVTAAMLVTWLRSEHDPLTKLTATQSINPLQVVRQESRFGVCTARVTEPANCP